MWWSSWAPSAPHAETCPNVAGARPARGAYSDTATRAARNRLEVGSGRADTQAGETAASFKGFLHGFSRLGLDAPGDIGVAIERGAV